MSRSPTDAEDSINLEGNISSNVAIPARLSFFGITHEQWGNLRHQVKSIDLNENLWLLACSVCLTIGVSFGIGATQIEDSENWIRTGFWMATAAGSVGAVACGIAGFQTRRRRKNDIKEILEYMDEIMRIDTE